MKLARFIQVLHETTLVEATVDDLVAQAIDYFGITNDGREAGFAVPYGGNSLLLDFSEKNSHNDYERVMVPWGTPTPRAEFPQHHLKPGKAYDDLRGTRYGDHRQIAQFLPDIADETAAMVEFMRRTGSVRIIGEQGISFTPEVSRWCLNRALRTVKGLGLTSIYVDLHTPSGADVTKEFSPKIETEGVLKWVRAVMKSIQSGNLTEGRERVGNLDVWVDPSPSQIIGLTRRMLIRGTFMLGHTYIWNAMDDSHYGIKRAVDPDYDYDTAPETDFVVVNRALLDKAGEDAYELDDSWIGSGPVQGEIADGVVLAAQNDALQTPLVAALIKIANRRHTKLTEAVVYRKVNPDTRQRWSVNKNPTPKELLGLMARATERRLRGWVETLGSRDFFIWDAEQGTHDEINRHCVPMDSGTPIEIVQAANGLVVEVYMTRKEAPEIIAEIRTNANFNRAIPVCMWDATDYMGTRKPFNEAVRPAYLYHGTPLERAVKILRSDQIKAATTESRSGTVSLSRSLRAAMVHADQFEGSKGGVVFVLDQDRLKQTHRVEPCSEFGFEPHALEKRCEVEERVHGAITDLSHYLVGVVLAPAVRAFLSTQKDAVSKRLLSLDLGLNPGRLDLHGPMNEARETHDGSGLTERADQIQSPEFQRWFGNSKVIDAQGNPLVVYKGMYPYDYRQETKDDPGPAVDVIDRPSEFPSFDDDSGIKIAGFFGDAETASKFASNFNRGSVFPVYLSIQNPYIIDAHGKSAGLFQFGKEGKPFRDAIRSGKYDGAIIRNTRDEGTIYVALRPNQIKSAISNTGRFDPDHPSIGESLIEVLAGLSQMKAVDLNESIDQLLTILRKSPWAGQIRIFGSVATGKTNPNDLDVIVDMRDRSSEDFINASAWLLSLARKFYGQFDPFILTRNGLLVRNPEATDWVRAKHAKKILNSPSKNLTEAAQTIPIFGYHGAGQKEITVHWNPGVAEFKALLRRAPTVMPADSSSMENV